MAAEVTDSPSPYRRPGFRLVPTPTAESKTFWTGGRNGALMIQFCQSCQHYFHPPAPVCWRCRCTDVSARPASGRAKVAAYTVNRQPWLPGFEPPYVVAMVELIEEPDVRIVTNIIDVAPQDVYVGLEVQVVFEDWTAPSGDEDTRVWLPLFQPV